MNDYKAITRATFIEAIDDLIAENAKDRCERMAAVHALIDAYIEDVGTRPDIAQLHRLSDYLLREEITDSHPDKMTINEYPIMSEVQEERRRIREYSLTLADGYDNDGVAREKPSRRRRTAREQRIIDQNAHDRNRTRSTQYKHYTSHGPVVPYNLRDTGGEMTAEFIECTGVGETWRDRLCCFNLVS